MAFPRLTSDEQWSTGLVAGLPLVWEKRLLGRWERLRKAKQEQDTGKARFAANTFIRTTVAALGKVRIPLDASDATICEAGQKLAEKCAELACVYHDLQTLHAAMVRVCDGQGVTSPPVTVREKDKEKAKAELLEKLHGAVARMTCPLWWRRKLREHHGKTLEGTAQALGYVHKDQEIYCSNETVYRRAQQNARNAATLEQTIARNELGQEYTLAELAATGVANKAIRRAELMTRIAGFERIAIDCGHVGLFVTSTCPSHMHPWRTVKGKKSAWTEPNPRYDGYSTPGTSQKYQAKLWQKIRAKFDREGIRVYGFRVAEPNHDGTPHWHYLVFVDPKHLDKVQAIWWKWALKDAPDEPGAKKHRIDIKLMQASKGTAAGYIAKYIAKNIDGYRVGTDLYGNDAIEASQRVEAWASTWRIRQFQQVGGPPVGVWRELRRVEVLPAGAPDHLVMAHQAVNKVAVIEGRDNASVAWDRYCRAQGGVFCGRNYRIALDMQPQEGLNRYGEKKPKRPVGVCTSGTEYHTPEWMAHIPAAQGCMARTVWWEVASKRMQWEIVANRQKGSVGGGAVSAPVRPHADMAVGSGLVLGSAHRAPWTCVNNCTEGGANGEFGRSGGAVGLEFSADSHQNHGGEVHGAGHNGAGAAGARDIAAEIRNEVPAQEPWAVWRDGSAEWLQGSELLQWKKQHLHGAWLPVGRG